MIFFFADFPKRDAKSGVVFLFTIYNYRSFKSVLGRWIEGI